MDELLDSYISSSVWPDTTLPKSSWNGAMVCQTNGLVDDSLETHGHGNNQITSILSSDDIIGNTTAEGLNLHGLNGTKSILAGGNMKYEADQGIYCGERSTHINLGGQTLQQNLLGNDTLDGTCSLQGVVGSIAAAQTFDSPITHNTVAISSSIESNGSEMSTFSQVLGDAHPFKSLPSIWPSSYSGVSSFTGQNKLQGFGYHGVENSDNILMKACLENSTHLNCFNSVSLLQKDQNGFQSISDGQQINLITGTLQSENEFQFSASPERLNTTNQMRTSGIQAQGAPTNANGCNGVAKPRVRARRGQATDPHSIAERLRREKIAERMRNLQELVPSSNKTDKASMLDEIIDYVKFLQLQVKVLSMSRLGAAGAVLPLLTNAQTEGSESVLTSSLAAEGAADIYESEESLAFEQEVVKLMETNVTSAIQYLQNKGVCLMPIALAAAISNQKNSPERRKSDARHGVFSLGSHNRMEQSPDSGANSCNGAVKQEESHKPRDNGDLNQKAK